MKRHNDKPIKDVLGDFLDHNKKVNAGFHSTQIEKIWRASMGPTISGFTSRIAYNRGTVKIYITSDSLRKELVMSREKIKSFLNEELKSELIERVELH
jgi:hypothetical protein